MESAKFSRIFPVACRHYWAEMPASGEEFKAAGLARRKFAEWVDSSDSTDVLLSPTSPVNMAPVEMIASAIIPPVDDQVVVALGTAQISTEGHTTRAVR